MGQRKMGILIKTLLLCCMVSFSYAQDQESQDTDSPQDEPAIYDPFGPENSPDHNGQGSGGVLTPSPYEDIIQTYYTRISADYIGIQNMLDCPWQFAAGLSWASYYTDIYGVMFKVRSTGFKKLEYDPVVYTDRPYYHLPFEASFDYSFNDTSNTFQAFKIRLHWESYMKNLGMAGIGALISNWNLMVASDLAMNRKWDVEFTWIQAIGGYIMPLSPKAGGVNTAFSVAVDLLGAKYQMYESDKSKFYGLKIGSIGWLAGFGWNALTLFNLSVYVGGEWNFSTGGLETTTDKIVRADISRNTLLLGLQLTGRYFNLVGGIQRESETLDYQKTKNYEREVRYYFGLNYYVRR